MKNDRLLLIDGFNLLSRGYFATSYGKGEDQLTKNSKGLYTNALRVFFQKLLNLISKHEISHVAVCWDIPRERSIRRLRYPEYKGTRGELPQALIQQFETCKQVLENMGIKNLIIEPYEADDVIGALSKRWGEEENKECLIYSNDKDLFQLINKWVSQIISSKNVDTVYSLSDFEQEYGISSNQWVDIKALLGDASDNIPGCKGIGIKSALSLIQHYGSIENVFESIGNIEKKLQRHEEKLKIGKESTILSKELSMIITNIENVATMNLHELRLNMTKSILNKELEYLEIHIKY